MAKMNIPEDLRAEFENTWEQSLAQFEAAAERGLPVREIDIHFLRKLDAMLKQDYKRLYEMEVKERRDEREREAAKPKWFGGQPAANGFGMIKAPPFFGATATASGGAGLCATATGGGGTAVASPADSYSSMPPLEAQPPPLLMPPKRKEESRVEDCSLHGPMLGGGLCHTANSRGYSMYSPPCNGCSTGQREREEGIWHSGFGEERNVFYSAASPIDASLVARKAEFMEPEPKSPIRPQRSTEEVWAAVCDMNSARAAAALERLERINLG